MLHVTLLPSENEPLVEGGAELLASAGRKWADVLNPTEEVLEVLRERFGLHRLAIEDCLHLDQRPKLDDYGDHAFLVLQGFRSQPHDACALDMHEMHMFLGPDWVITVHERPSDAVDEARRRVRSDPKGTIGRGADFVAYLVADALVDSNFAVLDQFSDELEDLESQIFTHSSPKQLQRIFDLKRSLVIVRRVLSPQRDVVGLLSRAGTPNVGERTVLYFRDVYDHLVRLYEQIDAARDLVGNAMEAHLSMVANKTNEITKRLTIFATIFLPLSFITGFFGQNFDVLSRPVFFWSMLAMVIALPLGLLHWFRKLEWV